MYYFFIQFKKLKRQITRVDAPSSSVYIHINNIYLKINRWVAFFRVLKRACFFERADQKHRTYVGGINLFYVRTIWYVRYVAASRQTVDKYIPRGEVSTYFK